MLPPPKADDQPQLRRDLDAKLLQEWNIDKFFAVSSNNTIDSKRSKPLLEEQGGPKKVDIAPRLSLQPPGQQHQQYQHHQHHQHLQQPAVVGPPSRLRTIENQVKQEIFSHAKQPSMLDKQQHRNHNENSGGGGNGGNLKFSLNFIKGFKREKSDILPLSKRHSSEISYNVNAKYVGGGSGGGGGAGVVNQRSSIVAASNPVDDSTLKQPIRPRPRREKTESVILRRKSAAANNPIMEEHQRKDDGGGDGGVGDNINRPQGTNDGEHVVGEGGSYVVTEQVIPRIVDIYSRNNIDRFAPKPRAHIFLLLLLLCICQRSKQRILSSAHPTTTHHESRRMTPLFDTNLNQIS